MELPGVIYGVTWSYTMLEYVILSSSSVIDGCWGFYIVVLPGLLGDYELSHNERDNNQMMAIFKGTVWDNSH